MEDLEPCLTVWSRSKSLQSMAQPNQWIYFLTGHLQSKIGDLIPKRWENPMPSPQKFNIEYLNEKTHHRPEEFGHWIVISFRNIPAVLVILFRIYPTMSLSLTSYHGLSHHFHVTNPHLHWRRSFDVFGRRKVFHLGLPIGSRPRSQLTADVDGWNSQRTPSVLEWLAGNSPLFWGFYRNHHLQMEIYSWEIHL